MTVDPLFAAHPYTVWQTAMSHWSVLAGQVGSALVYDAARRRCASPPLGQDHGTGLGGGVRSVLRLALLGPGVAAVDHDAGHGEERDERQGEQDEHLAALGHGGAVSGCP